MKRVLVIIPLLLIVFGLAFVKYHRTDEVALVFFGGSMIDVDQTIRMAKDVGANEIYMYMAYEGKISCNKPHGITDTYKVMFQGDSFAKQAIEAYHKNNLKVTAVLSSQLFGPDPLVPSFPLVQFGPGQNYLNLIDPQRAREFYTSVASEIASYGVDGIYVGEPYYEDFKVRSKDPDRSRYWNLFYRQINQKLQKNHPKVERQLVLPVHFFNYQGGSFGAGEKDHGLNPSIIREGFNSVGLDLSSIYVDGSERQLRETEIMASLAKDLGQKSSMAELSLNRFGTMEKIPIEFLIEQIRILRKYEITKTVLFCNKSLSVYNKEELQLIKNALHSPVDLKDREVKEVYFTMPQNSNWRKDIQKQVDGAIDIVDKDSIVKVHLAK